MLPTLANRVAIITGAATGIGRGIAKTLAGDGATVVVNYLDHPELADAVVADICAAGGKASAVQADISRPQEVRRLFDETMRLFGRVDILVNNAAVALLKPLAAVSEEDFDRVFSVNVKGTMFGCQQAAARMSAGGRIINMSSSTTGLCLPGYGLYDASKGAVEQLTRFFARELGVRQITVNAISPGATETDSYRIGKDPGFVASLERMSVFGRLGQVDEIARVVAFVASDAAGWITGQNIRVNGGTV